MFPVSACSKGVRVVKKGGGASDGVEKEAALKRLGMNALGSSV